MLQADGACYSPVFSSNQYIAARLPRGQNTQNTGIFLLFHAVLGLITPDEHQVEEFNNIRVRGRGGGVDLTTYGIQKMMKQ